MIWAALGAYLFYPYGRWPAIAGAVGASILIGDILLPRLRSTSGAQT